MNAQEKLLGYAREHNDNPNMTPEQFCGQMVTEGIVIDRTPGSMTVARMKREGQTIIVTETVKSETHEVVDGKLISTPVKETTEIFRVDV